MGAMHSSDAEKESVESGTAHDSIAHKCAVLDEKLDLLLRTLHEESTGGGGRVSGGGGVDCGSRPVSDATNTDDESSQVFHHPNPSANWNAEELKASKETKNEGRAVRHKGGRKVFQLVSS